MSKGDDTRKWILDRTAQVFNQRGYFGCSMADILRVTGLQKGGVYNHFGSKEQLALEAFDHAVDLVRERFADALRGKHNDAERLLALVQASRDYMVDPPIPGGCPIMNTAVESDDAHPALRARAIKAMDNWRALIVNTVNRGIGNGDIKPTVHADAFATLMIATMEGGLMMSTLYRDSIHLDRAADFMIRYIESQVRAERQAPPLEQKIQDCAETSRI